MSWLLDVGWWLVDVVIGFIKENPGKALIFAVFLFRMFGTTVQTGWKGVLFSFGRARKELDPGFHFLIPLVQRVRKTPIRAITLHLPMQRITTADGLVYDVQANLIYRIVDATRALVSIDDVRKGCEVVLPILIQDLLGARTRGQLQERKALDEELTARVIAKLERWGATVEQAGFMTIAPTSRTLRLMQLKLLARERERMMQRYGDEGLAPALALALLGADRKATSHSAARYRARSGQTAGLRKAYLKLYLAEERERSVQELVKNGLAREVAVVLAAADPTLVEQAEARARRMGRSTAARRRHAVPTSVSIDPGPV